MLQLSSECLKAVNSNSGVKMAVASLPDNNSLDDLNKSAVQTVRRPPAIPESTWKKIHTADEERAVSSSKDSGLYSADSIKASVRGENGKRKSTLRSINRRFPIRLISYGAFLAIILGVGFVVLQFAGLVELRYQTDMKAKQLAVLQHQRDELTIELEQKTALDHIEREAKALGMVYPSTPQRLDMGLAKAMDAQKVYAFAYKKR